MKILISLSITHAVTVKAAFVDVDVPLLIKLAVLSDLNALLDIGTDKIASPKNGLESTTFRDVWSLLRGVTTSSILHYSRDEKDPLPFLPCSPRRVFKVPRRVDPDG